MKIQNIIKLIYKIISKNNFIKLNESKFKRQLYRDMSVIS